MGRMWLGCKLVAPWVGVELLQGQPLCQWTCHCVLSCSWLTALLKSLLRNGAAICVLIEGENSWDTTHEIPKYSKANGNGRTCALLQLAILAQSISKASQSLARLNQTYNMVNNYVNRSGATATWLQATLFVDHGCLQTAGGMEFFVAILCPGSHCLLLHCSRGRLESVSDSEMGKEWKRYKNHLVLGFNGFHVVLLSWM